MMALFVRFGKIGWHRLLPLAIILGVIGTSALLGLGATPQLVFLTAVALVGAVAFIWLTRHIEWGILALVPVTFLVPFGVGTGTETEINLTILLTLLLLGVWVLRMLLFERSVSLVPTPVNIPALLFLVGVVLSFFGSNIPWLPSISARASSFAQIGGVLMLVLPVGTMLLAGNRLTDEKWLHWLVGLFLGLGAPYLLSQLIPGGAWVGRFYTGKSVSALFYLWSTALSGGMLLFNDALTVRQRWAMGGILILTLAVAVGPMSSSASSWAPALVTFAVLLTIKWWRLGLIVGLAGVLALALRYQQIYAILFRTEEYSAITRAATWPIMYQLVKASPMLGLGPANYYFYTPHFSLMGYYVQFNSHNNYWDLAAQLGLLGLGLFLWLAIALWRSGWKLRSRLVNGFQRGYVHAALAGLVGTLAAGLLADWFMPFVYNIGFDGFRGAVFAWLILGGLIVIDRLTTTQ
jgi:hypothetical protein